MPRFGLALSGSVCLYSHLRKYSVYAAVEDSKHRVHRDLNYVLPYHLKSFVTSVSDTNTLPGERGEISPS